eukprot:CAMPEP_0201491534 /NCGR_PEP_ID=MMETSP0151_2-20130828/30177_1 /ASSEMBLY_ACC=CAM_ASM_000257 /TAXON_ID=200890 /ORGANISM="Paramoeba atlantica, Strain 621/1 / CCAP 1560/9" /LENGTH=160 /DNA_ID=CAMNT_0047877929 /DNA_START=296 /DNA_END=774 /DNA_ORIENTATION=+
MLSKLLVDLDLFCFFCSFRDFFLSTFSRSNSVFFFEKDGKTEGAELAGEEEGEGAEPETERGERGIVTIWYICGSISPPKGFEGEEGEGGEREEAGEAEEGEGTEGEGTEGEEGEVIEGGEGVGKVRGVVVEEARGRERGEVWGEEGEGEGEGEVEGEGG